MESITNEEKARKIANDNCTHICLADCSEESYFSSEKDCYNAAMQAMKWKDEIMEKRIESSVSAEVGYFNQRGLSIYFDKSLEKLGLEEGDKVKVLIIKEDKL